MKKRYFIIFIKDCFDNKESQCLSQCCISLKRYCDQGNLEKQAFNWGLAYSSSRLVYDHHDRNKVPKGRALEHTYLI